MKGFWNQLLALKSTSKTIDFWQCFLDFVAGLDYVLQAAFFAQSLKIYVFPKENHYFSIIGMLAHGRQRTRKTINCRLETNIKIVGKTSIFQLKIYEKSS